MLLPGSMSGHRQDGRMRGAARGPFAFADQTRGLEPIQFRHLNVHENQIVAAFRKPLPDFLPFAASVTVEPWRLSNPQMTL